MEDDVFFESKVPDYLFAIFVMKYLIDHLELCVDILFVWTV